MSDKKSTPDWVIVLSIVTILLSVLTFGALKFIALCKYIFS